MIVINFDGACGPNNPGGKCGGGAVVRKDFDILAEIAERYVPKVDKQTSNNVGEYFGLIKALEFVWMKGLENEAIMVYGDSNMVINQMAGKWKIKKGIYSEQALICKKLVEKFKLIRFEWIPREENCHADELSKIALKKEAIYFC